MCEKWDFDHQIKVVLLRLKTSSSLADVSVVSVVSVVRCSCYRLYCGY